MNKRCVIVGGGVITDNLFIINNTSEMDFIIAADRGYDYCCQSGIIPDLIVGDFDSALKIPEAEIETIKLNPVKDCTDTEFAVNKAVELGFDNIIIIGGLGNRFDHSYANLTLVACFRDKNISITLIDENHKIYALKNETKLIKNENKYISVFSFTDSCLVSLSGFKYPLNNYLLSRFNALGVSNEVIDDNAEISITNGIAIIMEVNKNL